MPGIPLYRAANATGKCIRRLGWISIRLRSLDESGNSFLKICVNPRFGWSVGRYLKFNNSRKSAMFRNFQPVWDCRNVLSLNFTRMIPLEKRGFFFLKFLQNNRIKYQSYRDINYISWIILQFDKFFGEGYSNWKILSRIVIFEHEGWRIGWKKVRVPSKIRLPPHGGWYRTILISGR